MARIILLTAFSLLFAAQPIHGSVIYNFSGTGVFMQIFQIPVAFQLTVPDFINPPLNGGVPVSFTCSQLDSQTNCLQQPIGSVLFQNSSSPSPTFSASLIYETQQQFAFSFLFPAGAFDAPGVYNSGGSSTGSATLTVTATPEPSAILLVLSGMAIVIRSRSNRAASRR